MADSSHVRTPNYRRRITWLGVFVLVLIAGYSAGWFWLAGEIVDRARVAIAGVSQNGRSAECANPTARGYPFRIGLFCDDVGFADAAGGFRFTAGNFRSAGQIYDPLRLVSELDGPATVVAGDAGALTLDWRLLRASARLARPLPSRLSVEGQDLRVSTQAGAPLLTAERLEGHMRPNGADLDLAGSFEQLSLESDEIPGDLPPLSGSSDIVLTDGVARVVRGGESLRGQSGVVRAIEVVSGEAAIALSGPFSVDDDGLVDADLRIELRNPAALQALLVEALPESRDQIVAVMSGLGALGKTPSFPLGILKGKASLGFIPLGDIPPL